MDFKLVLACSLSICATNVRADEGDEGDIWYIRTVEPITDPMDSDWGEQRSGGEGTQESPFGSFEELLDEEHLGQGDIIEIDTQTSGIPNYGPVIIEGVADLTIRAWDGLDEKQRLVCGYPIDLETSHITGGVFDVYRTAFGATPEIPNRISQNWNTNINERGQRFGVLVSRNSPSACADSYGFYHDEVTGTLYVSIPAGADINNYEHIVGSVDHTLLMFNCPDAVVRDLSAEHAFSEEGTAGYGIRFDGDSPRCQAIFNEVDGCRWHSIGSVADNPIGTKIRNNHCKTTIQGNDSQLVIYVGAKGGQIAECEITDNVLDLDPWLGWDGQPALDRVDGVIGIACHSVPDAGSSPAGGLIIARNTTRWSGFNPSARSADLIFVAPHSRLGGRPSDIHDHSTYPVQLHDNRWGGHGMTVGGGHDSEIWVSSQRDRWDLNAPEMLAATGTAGLLGCAEGPGADNGLRFESCTISGISTTFMPSKSLLAVYQGATLILEDTSVYFRGTGYTTSTRLIAFASTAEAFSAKGCMFGAEQENVRLSTGNWSGAMPNTQAETEAWSNNWYAPNLHRTFNSSNGRQRNEFRFTIDPGGEFDAAPGLKDPVSLEPNQETREIKNEPRGSGHQGINKLPYDQTYGAWQFGAPCSVDINGDGALDFFDVSLYLSEFLSGSLDADLNADLMLDFFDVSLFITSFNAGCP